MVLLLGQWSDNDPIFYIGHCLPEQTITNDDGKIIITLFWSGNSSLGGTSANNIGQNISSIGLLGQWSDSDPTFPIGHCHTRADTHKR